MRNRYPDTHEKSTKNQSVTEWYRCSKCGAMDKNLERLCWHEMEAVEYLNYWVWDTVIWKQSLREFKGDCKIVHFCFDFVRSHARCGCYSIIYLRFRVVQMKQVGYKLSILWCLIAGGRESNCKFREKNPSSSFNYYKRMTQ